MSLAQFEGKALVFNNGVVDVQQNGVSVVDSEKIAHIEPGGVSEGRVNEMIDLKIGSEVSDAKIILCTQVGSDPAGPVGSFTLNQGSNKTITIPIPSGGSGVSEGKVNEMIDAKISELDYISEGDLNDALSNLDFASEGDIEEAISSLDLLSEGDVNGLIDLKIADLDYISEGDLNEALSNLDFASEGDIAQAIESLDLISEGDVNDLIDIKIGELDYASEGDISAAIAELDIPEYSAGDHISISSAGVISATGIPTFTYDPTTQSLEITL